jgi:uncharacterized membrane protein YidH (DUF202 family)
MDADATAVRTGSDRRTDLPRTRTLLAGRLTIGTGAAFLSPGCAITELSPHGARVSVPATTRLPPPVALLLIRDGLLIEAAVAWRRGNETGLAFKTRHDLHTETSVAYGPVRALWAQLAPEASADGSHDEE